MTTKKYFYVIDSDGYYNTYLSTMTDGVVKRMYLDSYETEDLAKAYCEYMNKKEAK